MADKLDTYRRKRDPRRTPEPVPDGPLPQGGDDTFVIQEHHARRLHWDFRLERNGVLVSWAIPKGLPVDPERNNLAVQTEDHPLEYASFAGEIPRGEYGGGTVTIWDRGTYEMLKWRPDEVIVRLRGSRPETDGRYALFRTGGDDWMIHRMDPPADPDREPLPELVRPMLATAGSLPPLREEDRWVFEMKWDGVRAVVYVEGGRVVRLLSRNDRDVSGSYPELRGLGEALGSTAAVLDGEIVAFDQDGRPDFGTLQQRMHVGSPSRSLMRDVPVMFFAFDVLWLDGRPAWQLPWEERRELLESLPLAGPHWQVPPVFEGDGEAAVDTSLAQGLEGVIAKRRDSTYEPGRRSRCWLKVKNVRHQEVVVGGWKPGEGNRTGGIGSLLIGVPDDDGGLCYVGHVGSGFTVAMLIELGGRLRRLERKTSPFTTQVPRPHERVARWVTPQLVGEVTYTERTRDGMLRHPVWRGLRPDKSSGDVRTES